MPTTFGGEPKKKDYC
ncbi:hypothetical protein [Staphylococcus aureus]